MPNETLYRVGQGPVDTSNNLGLLADLTGCWVGHGFNQIFLPDFDKNPPSTGPKAFRVLMNATRESLEFISLGGAVPNRGSEEAGQPLKGQNDINIFGLRYLQRISDLNTNEPLHIENGLWLNIPATDIPKEGPTVVRQGSIPHGASVMMKGTSFLSPTGKPVISNFDIGSMVTSSQKLPLGYLDPFLTSKSPHGIPQGAVSNPNLVLEEAIASLIGHMDRTVVLQVTSKPVDGVLNIPFLKNSVNNNAATTLAESTFWIERVVPPTGRPFDVLQYTQTVILNFLDIDWPHVSVATLFRQ